MGSHRERQSSKEYFSSVVVRENFEQRFSRSDLGILSRSGRIRFPARETENIALP
jgi:hypothetical protein